MVTGERIDQMGPIGWVVVQTNLNLIDSKPGEVTVALPTRRARTQVVFEVYEADAINRWENLVRRMSGASSPIYSGRSYFITNELAAY